MIAFAKRWIASMAIIATVLIGAADYVSGVSITLVQLTYLAPLVAGTWLRGRVFGLGLAVLAAACIGVTSFHLDAAGWPVALNTAGCFGVFVVVVVLCDRLRHYVEREQLQRWAAVEQLRHADRLNVIGVLAAGVAHELGTPLNVIAGNAELIDAEPQAIEVVRRSAATILHQTDKISNIITHLLAFGRRGHNGREVVELDRVARSAAELIGSTARKRNTNIDVIPSAMPVCVRATDAQVEQVLSNLLLNAIQAMPGGGTVRVRTGIETRSDASETARSFGSIVVEDEGNGIAAADLPRIFDPFFTTKDVGEGTGLGLSVSYGIVQDHGGSIEVASASGHGTRFTVLLPLS